jgi:hypothetical protein
MSDRVNTPVDTMTCPNVRECSHPLSDHGMLDTPTYYGYGCRVCKGPCARPPAEQQPAEADTYACGHVHPTLRAICVLQREHSAGHIGNGITWHSAGDGCNPKEYPHPVPAEQPTAAEPERNAGWWKAEALRLAEHVTTVIKEVSDLRAAARKANSHLDMILCDGYVSSSCDGEELTCACAAHVACRELAALLTEEKKEG